MLQPNIQAPEFTLPDQDDNPVSLVDYRGKKVVLVFYPKDESPVCTRQLRNYTENIAEFREKNAEILAISADSRQSHKQFAASHEIPFPLLADTDKSVCKKYDVLTAFGAVRRAVYIIGERGTIVSVFKRFPLFYPHANELLGAL